LAKAKNIEGLSCNIVIYFLEISEEPEYSSASSFYKTDEKFKPKM
jgi:hypothetical protein